MLCITLLAVLLISLSSGLFASPILFPTVELSPRVNLPDAQHWPSVAVGSTISDDGGYGIVYNDPSNPGAVIKMIHYPPDPTRRRELVTKEVNVLHTLGELINWGITGTDADPKWYIRMKKVPGKPMSESPEYRQASAPGKEKIQTDVINKAAGEILRICQTTGIHHYDFHEGNVLVTFSGSQVTSVGMVDWGDVRDHGDLRCDSQDKIAAQVASKFHYGATTSGPLRNSKP